MPILPIIPQKSKYKRTPSLTFRRLTLFLLLIFISLSGSNQMLNQENNKLSESIIKTSFANQKQEISNVLSISSASASTTSEVTINQVRQLAIGSEKLQPTQTPTPTGTDSTWGVAHQIAPDTWSMKIQPDPKMASPQEIFSALNDYRQRHGKSILSWDDKLANFANARTQYFTSINKLDSHVGFLDYVNNQDGFHKLGYANIGENSSIGYTLESVHLIEWVYAGDKPHDDNQLSSNWQSVGIGVNASSTDLIFAGSKL